MRVCLDANLLISALLHSSSERSPGQIVEAAIAGRFHLILSQTTLQELVKAVENMPYLNARISADEITEFVATLQLIGSIVPEISELLPAVTRDPGDDYLIAHAVLEEIDYLVTGDKDLLVLRQIDMTRIVSPARFVAILQSETDP